VPTSHTITKPLLRVESSGGDERLSARQRYHLSRFSDCGRETKISKRGQKIGKGTMRSMGEREKKGSFWDFKRLERQQVKGGSMIKKNGQCLH